jgi:two-component system NtrC family sensor kinase
VAFPVAKSEGGVRAEKSGFNITLQRDFDASASSIELFPQEITRALLNLLSNGFFSHQAPERDW